MTQAALPYAEVIGDPIAQSKSPLIHGHWLAELGLEAEYRAHRVEAGGVPAYLDARRQDPDWRGCNITMPHKQTALELVDRLDPLARRIGAINTIVREGEALVGCNTDAPGFLEPLKDRLGQQHLFRMARVLGTGGAARAIVAALAAEGFVIVLAGRNLDKARALLDELDPGGEHHVAPLEHFAAPTDFAFDDREGCCDLVVNASPLGMRGQSPLSFDWSHAPPRSLAYDIVTDPLDTPFLAGARAAGLETVDGLSMLIGQAAIAFEKFFGAPPPRADRDAALRQALAQ
ncbi:shikimate dehydrogenase family protein [Paraurantiacibacter namhicola]|uniref:Shikimate dehydrogenase (NADP(+)) n=1 Tax=Paraurantiacibacter namhicola TaxID=645517 RepID=A0A1C7D5N0_9SPHN|nr:shikimate dehydrogenase [Paraurantiacibacter namhicola]ANU06758.1 Shikimate dehydrogenase [Paraurantiacibacter namhicola]